MKKVMKKCLTLFLTLTLMLGMLQLPLSAAAADIASGNWIDYIGSSDLVYSSSTTAYTIDSTEDLAWVAYEVNSGVTTFSGCTFNVTKDIDLSAHFWTPIGSSSAACFSGTFNGNDYTVSGLTIGTSGSPATLQSAGLFGYVSGATVENVRLSTLSIYVLTAYAVGGVAGTASNGAVIEGCYISGNFGSGEITCLGGICGTFYDTSIMDGIIKNCSTSCNLDGYWYAGGIIGFSRYITVMNCSSAGLISGEHVVSGSYSAGGTGGIAGASETTTVQNCFSSCDIIGTSTFAGGLSAYTYSSVYTNNYSVGSVHGNKGDVGVGGFFGAQWSNTVTNCYWEKADGLSASGTSFGSSVVTLQTEAYMKSADFTTLLNGNATAITDSLSWSIVPGENSNYPRITGVGVFGALSAPMALNPTVSGYLVPGMTLTADYDYCDLHNAAESGTTYQWYEASDSSGSDIAAISGATSKTYALTANDLGNYLCVEVTPSNGTLSGSTEKSAMTAVVTSSIFTLGSGSASDPYQILNLVQLQSVANYPTAHFKLNNDITDALTSPICDNTTKLTGSFDGNGHSITIDISSTTSSYVGAFGYIGSGGYISNLTVKGAASDSSSTNYVGGLVGYNAGTIENCKSEVNVTASGSTGYMAGGLAGYNSGTISNSSASGEVTGGTATGTCFIGGLVGNNNSTSTTSGGTTTLSNKATLTNCYATGKVTSLAPTTSVAVGGLVGANYLSSTSSLTTSNYNITECYATGAVISSGGYAGGFMGISMVTSVTKCFASGKVSATGAVYAGAFAGFTRSGAIIDHCYATGSVGGNSTKKSTTFYGGFIGYFSSGTIQYSYSGSTVSTNNAYSGGMVGYYKAGTVTGCYWNTGKNTLAVGSDSSSTSDVTTYGTGLTTAKMVGEAASTNMPALDFTTPYFTTKTSDENYGYTPQLNAFAGSANDIAVAASITSVMLSSACSITAWTSPSGAAVSGTSVTATVANSVSSLAVDVTVSDGATWKLYSDSNYTSELTDKTMTLNVGDNAVYVLVTAENGTTTQEYTLTVTRETALISSITVTGDDNATSIKNGNTLQMSAAVLPDNATDKSITWSVTNGTGSATIDENGLLTANAVGTVTVMATAKDSSGKYGSAEITIVPDNTIPARKSGVAATGTASITVNDSYTLDLSTIFEDADSDALTYKVSVNGGAEQTAAERYSYTPTTTDGVTLVFKANDSKTDSSDTYTVTLTVNPINTYSIGLSQTSAYTFTSQMVGYSALSPLSVTVTSTGNQETGDLTLALIGDNAANFTLSKSTVSSIAAGSSDTFTVVPNDGLAAGTYTATVTVSGNNVTVQTFTVSFTVESDTRSSAKAITGFALGGVDGTITEADHTIAVTLPYGTDVTSLIPTITVSANATVSPTSGRAQDFTDPVTYTVTAENGTTQTYTVTVTVESDTRSSAKAITDFTLDSVDGTIIEADHTIVVMLPYRTDVTSLTPTITVSANATVSPTSGTAQDFTDPVTYTVTAENGTTQTYTVTVTVNPINTYSIGLSQTSAYTFTSQMVGYSTVTPLSVTVTSTGNQATGALTAALSGANASSFTLSKSILSSIAAGSTDTFTVKPNMGLSAGTYSATVTVSGDNVTSWFFTVSFTVSNGSSGGGNSSSSKSNITVTTENNITTASQTFAAYTGSNGVAAASVTSSQISEMLAAAKAKASTDAQTAVNLQVQIGSGATGVSVTLPKAVVTTLTSGEASLTVSSAVATVTLDNTALAEISKQASGDVTITATEVDISALSTEAKTAIGTRPVYDLKITSGSTTVSSFGGGTATVSIPYTPVAGEDANAIVVYYINASGELDTVPNCVYDAETGTVTFTTTHFSTYAVGYNAVSFKDVSDSAWYADYVAYLAARGIIGGNNGAFSPDASITRAEFVTILARMSGDDLSGYTTSSFSDVSTDSWYFAAAQWASKAGIASGYDGKFSPSASITREQMAAMLYRYAEYKGTVSNAEGMSVREFSDYDSIASWAQAPIQWAMNNGILSGNTDGSFAPQSSATRAQAAKMIAVLMQKAVK
ncbi:exported hypothetical protein [uncultured Eubacteriales bacterium]|uniref:SLH domain-containing protein n=1 Tax=uncultured Eubacteriales bacterium TaxID=172733 RepID=A0A212JM45_9FIRM|nr:exported hypothetical protein [uncultured Eubacteriales bacterium]